MTATNQFAAHVGLDWADKKHDVCVQFKNGERVFDVIEHTAEALDAWLTELHQKVKGRIAIALELKKGPVVYALQKYPFRTTKLVTLGCYAWSRNPIYLGMSGLQLSVALCFGSLVGILAVPLFMFVVARLHIHVEEVQLRKRFGLEWERYTQRVRRWL